MSNLIKRMKDARASLIAAKDEMDTAAELYLSDKTGFDMGDIVSTKSGKKINVVITGIGYDSEEQGYLSPYWKGKIVKSSGEVSSKGRNIYNHEDYEKVN